MHAHLKVASCNMSWASSWRSVSLFLFFAVPPSSITTTSAYKTTTRLNNILPIPIPIPQAVQPSPCVPPPPLPLPPAAARGGDDAGSRQGATWLPAGDCCQNSLVEVTSSRPGRAAAGMHNNNTRLLLSEVRSLHGSGVIIVRTRTEARSAVDSLVAGSKEANPSLIYVCHIGDGDSGVVVYCGGAPIWFDAKVINELTPFLSSPVARKVWHDYSAGCKALRAAGVAIDGHSGFAGDTMHMARLLDPSRGGSAAYSLRALEHRYLVVADGQPKLHCGGRKKNSDCVPRARLIRSAVTDAKATWQLWGELSRQLRAEPCRTLNNLLPSSSAGHRRRHDDNDGATMFDLYLRVVNPFGRLLTEVEAEGMLVACEDGGVLAEAERRAERDRKAALVRFRRWVSHAHPHGRELADRINPASTAQIRQLLFGGAANMRPVGKPEAALRLPVERTFSKKISSSSGGGGEGWQNITIRSFGLTPAPQNHGASGWPSVSNAALLGLTGDEGGMGPAYYHFGGGAAGREACRAIDALRRVLAANTLLRNFIRPLRALGRGATAARRVRCSLNLHTATGRLSSRCPNLQNLPSLEKDRYGVRKAFTAAPGRSLIVADYGQLELRLLAHFARCRSMVRALGLGACFHSRTAAALYPHVRRAVERGDVLLDARHRRRQQQRDRGATAKKKKRAPPLLKDVYPAERRRAKRINFSIVYGMSTSGLARELGVPIAAANAMLQKWFRKRPQVRNWQRRVKLSAMRDGSVPTLLGRRRPLPGLRSSQRSVRNKALRAAINTPIQGSAADIVMLAMLRLQASEQLRATGWKILMQVHDEIVLEGPSDTAAQVLGEVCRCMENPLTGAHAAWVRPLSAPLTVDAKVVANWSSAAK